MSFWTVGDAGPYKVNINVLMRNPIFRSFFVGLVDIGRSIWYNLLNGA